MNEGSAALSRIIDNVYKNQLDNNRGMPQEGVTAFGRIWKLIESLGEGINSGFKRLCQTIKKIWDATFPDVKKNVVEVNHKYTRVPSQGNETTISKVGNTGLNLIGSKTDDIKQAEDLRRKCQKKMENGSRTRVNTNVPITKTKEEGDCTGVIIVNACEHFQGTKTSVSAHIFQMLYESIQSLEPLATEFKEETLQSLKDCIKANPGYFKDVKTDEVNHLLERTAGMEYEKAIKNMKGSKRRTKESIKWARAIRTVMENRKNEETDLFTGVEDHIAKHMRQWNSEKNSRAAFNFVCLESDIKEISLEDQLGSSSMYETDQNYIENITKLPPGFYTCSFKTSDSKGVPSAHLINFIIKSDGSGSIKDPNNNSPSSFEKIEDAVHGLARIVSNYPLPKGGSKHEMTISNIVSKTK